MKPFLKTFIPFESSFPPLLDFDFSFQRNAMKRPRSTKKESELLPFLYLPFWFGAVRLLSFLTMFIRIHLPLACSGSV